VFFKPFVLPFFFSGKPQGQELINYFWIIRQGWWWINVGAPLGFLCRIDLMECRDRSGNRREWFSFFLLGGEHFSCLVGSPVLPLGWTSFSIGLSLLSFRFTYESYWLILERVQRAFLKARAEFSRE
jgi:hypothetical protein